MGELLAPGGRHHHELQVRALGAAVENVQIDAELVPKMTHDVLHHVGLCGCGQTQHRRDRLRACLLADEASHVAVVGSEVVLVDTLRDRGASRKGGTDGRMETARARE